MPDIRLAARKSVVRERVSNAWWSVYWWGFWGTELASALLVITTAVALQVAHIELQYVAGGLLAVFARKIATKRIFVPTKSDNKDETARPVREMLAKLGDRKAAAMNVDIAP